MLILWYLVVNVRIKNAKDKQTPQPSQTQNQNTKTTDINKIKQMEYYKTSQFIKHHTCTNMPLRYVRKTYFTIEKYTVYSIFYITQIPQTQRRKYQLSLQICCSRQ